MNPGLAIQVLRVGKRYPGQESNAYRTLRDILGHWGQRTASARPEAPWALRDLSFEVPRGEILGIVGRNGAGKSTLLKMIARVTRPSEGKIRVWGHVAPLLEAGTGFNPELTGRENIFLNGAILGMRRLDIQRKLPDIIAFAGIEAIDRPIKHYSSGMKLRLAFAIIVHLEAEVLLIDEGFSVTDAFFQQECLTRLAQRVQAGCTVLLSSHQLEFIETFCQRVLWLEQGNLRQAGDAGDVVAAYRREIGP